MVPGAPIRIAVSAKAWLETHLVEVQRAEVQYRETCLQSVENEMTQAQANLRGLTQRLAEQQTLLATARNKLAEL
jgi:hypothetical protein